MLYIAAFLFGSGCLIVPAVQANGDITTITDHIFLDVNTHCSFMTVADSASAADGEYIATGATNAAEVSFTGGNTHVFNVACNQSSGYTVTAYATDLARSGGGGAITFVNYANYTSTKTSNPDNAIWSAQLSGANTGAIFGTQASPEIIKSTDGISGVNGDEFRVNYVVYIGSTTPAGTYSGEAVYTLTMKPLPDYNWSVVYNAGAAGASATNLPTTQSGTSSPDSDVTVTLSSDEPTASGYSFLGWDTSATADTVVYTPGQEITIPKYRPNLSLYAVWEMATFQAFTASDCSAISTGNTTPVKDTRDNKVYLVSRLADNNCWMVQNLAIAPGTTLTSTDSDVSTNYTIPTTVTFNCAGGTCDWYSDVDADFEDQSAVLPEGDAGYIPATRNGYDANGNADDTKNTGGYYTYTAAVAGTNIGSANRGQYAPASICPKGWRLPTYDEQEALVGAYDYDYDSFAPVWGSALVGVYYDGSLIDSGDYSYWWSGTRYSNAGGAIYLYMDDGCVYSLSDVRVGGISVRCVFGARS